MENQGKKLGFLANFIIEKNGASLVLNSSTNLLMFSNQFKIVTGDSSFFIRVFYLPLRMQSKRQLYQEIAVIKFPPFHENAQNTRTIT